MGTAEEDTKKAELTNIRLQVRISFIVQCVVCINHESCAGGVYCTTGEPTMCASFG